MKKLIVLAFMVLIATPAMARAFLDSEEENGTLKYCKYDNGVIITINYLSSCPLAINS
jgi:uncharacterized protein YdeI (BOF family)